MPASGVALRFLSLRWVSVKTSVKEGRLHELLRAGVDAGRVSSYLGQLVLLLLPPRPRNTHPGWPGRFFYHKPPMPSPLLVLLLDFLQLFDCLILVFAVYVTLSPTQRAPVLDIVPRHSTPPSSRLVASG